MMVARQFIAWNRLEKGFPSCRDGVIFIPGCALELRAPLTDSIIPSRGTGAIFIPIPGNKLPGLPSCCPSGTDPSANRTLPALQRLVSVLSHK